MKKLLYAGLAGLGLFEILKVYFIMPMPGSQQMESIDVAYFLHSFRWYFRIFFGIMIAAGSVKAFRDPKPILPAVALTVVVAIVYFFNFRMTADHMFLQPRELIFAEMTRNVLQDSSMVLAISHEGEAKAYPIRYIAYHHQVRDTVGSKPVMVTYCNVCRTGRVFEPVVNGEPENFRLVGMDHFNAMFEDQRTKSWWRQATGEAVAGKLRGHSLPEFESSQMTVKKFFTLYPFGSVMQAEEQSLDYYDSLARFEKGKSRSHLTRTDSLSWKDKSWIVGLEIDGISKAYDWNDLKRLQLIQDTVAGIPVLLVLSRDNSSFAAFQRNRGDELFEVRDDSLISSENSFDFAGRARDGTRLRSINAYQEFWHSWKTFHPNTRVYEPAQ